MIRFAYFSIVTKRPLIKPAGRILKITRIFREFVATALTGIPPGDGTVFTVNGDL